jgi:hypothetical protein
MVTYVCQESGFHPTFFFGRQIFHRLSFEWEEKREAVPAATASLAKLRVHPWIHVRGFLRRRVEVSPFALSGNIRNSMGIRA